MGLYIKKSFNFGPFRINISKSGIGISIGVTGFRIGMKPNGKTYVHSGRKGLYYRKNIPSKTKDKTKEE